MNLTPIIRWCNHRWQMTAEGQINENLLGLELSVLESRTTAWYSEDWLASLPHPAALTSYYGRIQRNKAFHKYYDTMRDACGSSPSFNRNARARVITNRILCVCSIYIVFDVCCGCHLQSFGTTSAMDAVWQPLAGKDVSGSVYKSKWEENFYRSLASGRWIVVVYTRYSLPV